MHSYVLKEIEIENGILHEIQLKEFEKEIKYTDIIILSMTKEKATVVFKGTLKIKSEGVQSIKTAKNNPKNGF